MATFDYSGYDDDQIVWPGGSPSNGDTITFTQATDHVISITDNDSTLVDGTDDRDDEDSTQTAIVYDEFGDVEASGQVQPRDEITLSDGTNTFFMTEVFIASSNSYYYIFHDPAPALGVEYTVTNVSNPNSTSYSEFSTAGISCFTAGTLIRTPDGERPVETLQRGDLVCTVDRGAQPILWVGGRRVSYTQMRHRKGLRPFHVRANSFGPERPFADTWFSRQHRLLLSDRDCCSSLIGETGALAPVHALTGLASIEERCPLAGVRYFHILTREHNLLWSNGLEAETLLLTNYSVGMMRDRQARIETDVRGLVPMPMHPIRPILENHVARCIVQRIGRYQTKHRRAATVFGQNKSPFSKAERFCIGQE